MVYIRTMKAIHEKGQLDNQGLSELLSGEIQILKIPNYCSEEFNQEFVSAVKSQNTECYNHETEVDGKKVYHYYGVDRIGKSFNTTYSGGVKAKEEYYNQVLSSTRLIRKLGGKNISPIDRLRLELEEVWPEGAQIGRFENQTMLAGITRITTSENSELLGSEPHVDILPAIYEKFERQIAANIYLQLPDDGGELEVWPTHSDISEDFLVPPNWSQQLDVKSISYKPMPGDLLLFNARRPHAVHRFQGQARISLQCFIGFNKGKPLQIWN